MRSSIKNSGRKLGLALALMVAATSVATASASASLPEFEYSLPTPGSFSGGQMVFEGSGISVKCETAGGGGIEWIGSKQFVSHLTFKGCNLNLFGFVVGKCSSAGAAEGEIVAKELATRVEYISKATREVALIFNYGGKNSTIATFKCGSDAEAIRGEAVAKITPVNTLVTKFTVAFNGAGGVQELTQYENEKGEKVTVSPLELGTNGAFEKSSLKSTGLSLQLGQQARIKA